MEIEKQYLTCNGIQLKTLVQAGLNWLENNHQRVNDLNVFPVPDGDTGTNMLLTMRNAVKEVHGVESEHIGTIAKKIAHGAVMGSRGNSGTIMSQIWSGFAETLASHKVLDKNNIITALRRATDKAYGGVQHPVEGTILTVIREITEAVEANAKTLPDLKAVLDLIVEEGWQSVKRTPELLPVLRDANVVDSGGTGLMYIFEGMHRLLYGESVDVEGVTYEEQIESMHAENGVVQHPGENFYDVQFILKGTTLDGSRIKADIEAMGESAVVVATDTLVKVHVHVSDPSRPIGYAVQFGQITDVVVENMLEQYEEYVEKHQVGTVAHSSPEFFQVNPGEIAVIAVTPGPGFADIFLNLQVAGLVSGGQTNNPSVEDFLQSIDSIDTDKIILLPNNKNIILTAQQAAKMLSDRQVMVVPTRTVPQGISAMLHYNPTGDLTEVSEQMEVAKQDIHTAELTIAVRSVEIEGINVTEGQVIGLLDGKLRAVGNEMHDVAMELLELIDLDEMELITIYYGKEQSEADAMQMRDALIRHYPDLEFELLAGGQPHYPYILSVE